MGEEVTLNCTVQNAEKYTVSWVKKMRDRPSESFVFTFESSLTVKDDRFSIEYNKNTTTYSFKIKEIQQADTGLYECQIIISTTEKLNSSVELLVRHPPVINDNLTTLSTTVPEFQPASLTCQADGYPRPSITWRRTKNGILPQGGHSFAGNVLKIESVRREDRGTYVCVANNDVGKSAEKPISLEVEFPPRIRVPRPKVAQALDYDIILECQVEAYPAPTVEWYRNGQPIYNGDDYKISHLATADEVTNSALLIESVEPENYGDYYCKASNKLGKAEERLNVFGKINDYSRVVGRRMVLLYSVWFNIFNLFRIQVAHSKLAHTGRVDTRELCLLCECFDLTSNT